MSVWGIMRRALLLLSLIVLWSVTALPFTGGSFFSTLVGPSVYLAMLPDAETPSGGLPARATPTATEPLVLALPTPGSTPLPTSPFVFPTPSPMQATSARECTLVFPIGSVEAIEIGQTQIAQLEASFGQGTPATGRPIRFKFESEGCVMLVAIGVQEAQEVELRQYATLGWLLDRYGRPAAVGESEGNLTLMMTGYAVLLYPELGVTAIFDVKPEDLRRDTVMSSLFFRQPYEAESQVTRLNLRLVEWQPPLR